MKFQVIRPFSVTNKGRRVEYKLGQRIGESAYQRLTKSQQQRFLPARRCGNKNWSNAEYQLLAELYVKYAPSIDTIDRNAIIEEFCQQFSTRTKDSVLMYIQVCVRIDNKMPSKEGLANPAEGLVIALQDIDADRFTECSFEDKLDSLLADIRAW